MQLSYPLTDPAAGGGGAGGHGDPPALTVTPAGARRLDAFLRASSLGGTPPSDLAALVADALAGAGAVDGRVLARLAARLCRGNGDPSAVVATLTQLLVVLDDDTTAAAGSPSHRRPYSCRPVDLAIALLPALGVSKSHLLGYAWRLAAADAREGAADAREGAADAREGAADARKGAADGGGASGDTPAAVLRSVIAADSSSSGSAGALASPSGALSRRQVWRVLRSLVALLLVTCHDDDGDDDAGDNSNAGGSDERALASRARRLAALADQCALDGTACLFLAAPRVREHAVTLAEFAAFYNRAGETAVPHAGGGPVSSGGLAWLELTNTPKWLHTMLPPPPQQHQQQQQPPQYRRRPAATAVAVAAPVAPLPRSPAAQLPQSPAVQLPHSPPAQLPPSPAVHLPASPPAQLPQSPALAPPLLLPLSPDAVASPPPPQHPAALQSLPLLLWTVSYSPPTGSGGAVVFDFPLLGDGPPQPPAALTREGLASVHPTALHLTLTAAGCSVVAAAQAAAAQAASDVRTLLSSLQRQQTRRGDGSDDVDARAFHSLAAALLADPPSPLHAKLLRATFAALLAAQQQSVSAAPDGPPLPTAVPQPGHVPAESAAAALCVFLPGSKSDKLSALFAGLGGGGGSLNADQLGLLLRGVVCALQAAQCVGAEVDLATAATGRQAVPGLTATAVSASTLGCAAHAAGTSLAASLLQGIGRLASAAGKDLRVTALSFADLTQWYNSHQQTAGSPSGHQHHAAAPVLELLSHRKFSAAAPGNSGGGELSSVSPRAAHAVTTAGWDAAAEARRVCGSGVVVLDAAAARPRLSQQQQPRPTTQAVPAAAAESTSPRAPATVVETLLPPDADNGAPPLDEEQRLREQLVASFLASAPHALPPLAALIRQRLPPRGVGATLAADDVYRATMAAATRADGSLGVLSRGAFDALTDELVDAWWWGGSGGAEGAAAAASGDDDALEVALTQRLADVFRGLDRTGSGHVNAVDCAVALACLSGTGVGSSALPPVLDHLALAWRVFAGTGAAAGLSLPATDVALLFYAVLAGLMAVAGVTAPLPSPQLHAALSAAAVDATSAVFEALLPGVAYEDDDVTLPLAAFLRWVGGDDAASASLPWLSWYAGPDAWLPPQAAVPPQPVAPLPSTSSGVASPAPAPPSQQRHDDAPAAAADVAATTTAEQVAFGFELPLSVDGSTPPALLSISDGGVAAFHAFRALSGLAHVTVDDVLQLLPPGARVTTLRDILALPHAIQAALEAAGADAAGEVAPADPVVAAVLRAVFRACCDDGADGGPDSVCDAVAVATALAPAAGSPVPGKSAKLMSLWRLWATTPGSGASVDDVDALCVDSRSLQSLLRRLLCGLAVFGRLEGGLGADAHAPSSLAAAAAATAMLQRASAVVTLALLPTGRSAAAPSPPLSFESFASLYNGPHLSQLLGWIELLDAAKWGPVDAGSGGGALTEDAVAASADEPTVAGGNAEPAWREEAAAAAGDARTGDASGGGDDDVMRDEAEAAAAAASDQTAAPAAAPLSSSPRPLSDNVLFSVPVCGGELGARLPRVTITTDAASWLARILAATPFGDAEPGVLHALLQAQAPDGAAMDAGTFFDVAMNDLFPTQQQQLAAADAARLTRYLAGVFDAAVALRPRPPPSAGAGAGDDGAPPPPAADVRVLSTALSALGCGGAGKSDKLLAAWRAFTAPSPTSALDKSFVSGPGSGGAGADADAAASAALTRRGLALYLASLLVGLAAASAGPRAVTDDADDVGGAVDVDAILTACDAIAAVVCAASAGGGSPAAAGGAATVTLQQLGSFYNCPGGEAALPWLELLKLPALLLPLAADAEGGADDGQAPGSARSVASSLQPSPTKLGAPLTDAAAVSAAEVVIPAAAPGLPPALQLSPHQVARVADTMRRARLAGLPCENALRLVLERLPAAGSSDGVPSRVSVQAFGALVRALVSASATPSSPPLSRDDQQLLTRAFGRVYFELADLSAVAGMVLPPSNADGGDDEEEAVAAHPALVACAFLCLAAGSPLAKLQCVLDALQLYHHTDGGGNGGGVDVDALGAGLAAVMATFRALAAGDDAQAGDDDDDNVDVPARLLQAGATFAGVIADAVVGGSGGGRPLSHAGLSRLAANATHNPSVAPALSPLLSLMSLQPFGVSPPPPPGGSDGHDQLPPAPPAPHEPPLFLFHSNAPDVPGAAAAEVAYLSLSRDACLRAVHAARASGLVQLAPQEVAALVLAAADGVDEAGQPWLRRHTLHALLERCHAAAAADDGTSGSNYDDGHNAPAVLAAIADAVYDACDGTAGPAHAAAAADARLVAVSLLVLGGGSKSDKMLAALQLLAHPGTGRALPRPTGDLDALALDAPQLAALFTCFLLPLAAAGAFPGPLEPASVSRLRRHAAYLAESATAEEAAGGGGVSFPALASWYASHAGDAPFLELLHVRKLAALVARAAE